MLPGDARKGAQGWNKKAGKATSKDAVPGANPASAWPLRELWSMRDTADSVQALGRDLALHSPTRRLSAAVGQVTWTPGPSDSA